METTAYRRSGGSRTVDSAWAASRSSTTSHIRARSQRADLSADLSQDDPIPLFLSDPLGTPDPREFAPDGLRSGRRIPRVLAAVLTAGTVAMLAVLFPPDLRGLVAAYAGNTTSAAPDGSTAAANASIAQPVPLEDAARVSRTILASAKTDDLPPPSKPTREAIATAYQSALQAQVPALVAPTTAPPPAPPAKTLDAETLAGLMARGKSMIGVGDIAAARLLLERAANAGDATAALLLARTYDPAVLGTKDTRSVNADAGTARDWYQRAAILGSAEAQQRLAQLSN